MKTPMTSVLALPALALAFRYPWPSTSLSPVDVLEIRNTLSTYALAVDGKDAKKVASLFTTDAVATFTTPDQTVKGGNAIAEHDLYTFTGLNTFHQLSTQTLSPNANGTVEATTYFDATIFGKDSYQGQVISAAGSYLDRLAKINGTWLIANRQQVYANPEDPFIGNIAIIFGNSSQS